MQLKIATFNLENLFTRFATIDDPERANAPHVLMTGVTSIDYQGNALSRAVTVLQRNNTARAILESAPDILAVQEVENLWTLRFFNDEYLSGYFDRMLLIEGNDGRGIDVGFCLRKGCAARVSGLRTHIDDLDASNAESGRVNRNFNDVTREVQVTGALFSRDCLEVDIEAGKTPLTLLVNHFKSQDGSKAGNTRRHAQAARVAQIASECHKRGRLPIVIGDLNEDFSKSPSNLQPLKDLLGSLLSDPFAGEADNFTHYYALGNETSRLDYILPAVGLKVVSRTILRKGITLKCAAAGERFPTVGYVDTEASDHCPVSITLEIPD
jgi:endonuclease/exonuclease/phosphatase family metal-dependent hydrolase